MTELNNEILMIVMQVLIREASEEDMKKLEAWCHLQDQSGVLFSELSDLAWIRVNLKLLNEINIKLAIEDIWRRIREASSSQDDMADK